MQQSNDEAPADERRLTLILFNVCVGQFIVGLDQRALLVALPTLTHTFNTSLTTIQWVLLIYDLLLIGTVITVGRLGDLFGRRRYYAAGFLVFVLGSALCGAAQSAWQIILFRGLQAVGGAMISANGRAIASVAFPASERGKAMGFASMAFHVGFLTGPTLGGFLIDTVGWRDSSVAIMLMLSMVAGALFVFVELRSHMPILSFALFRNRLFTASMLSLFFITSTQSAISFLMPFYLQNILHFSPTHMGWILIANSVVIVLIAPIAGWLSDRMGSRLLCTARSGLIVIGQFFIASLGVDSSIPRIILPLLLIGLGWAIFNSPNQSAILGSVPRDKVGTASGMNTTTARTGGAMGVALSATLFTYGLAAAGVTRAQVESPQLWGEAPELFVRSFNHTVHIVNIVTLLSVFFSAVRGRQQE